MYIAKLNKLTVKYNYLFFSLIYFLMILIKASYSPNGYLGPDASHMQSDATWFLEGAKNILEYKFLFFDELNLFGNEIKNFKNYGSFLGAWPPLYPFLIASVSFILNIDVFIASKLLNFFCFLISFYILRKYIASNLLIFFIFCNATIIEVYSYTHTEFLFITLMISLVHNLNIYFSNNKKTQLIFIFIIMNMIFLTRYNGLSAHLTVFFLSLYFLLFKKKLYLNLFFLVFFALFLSFIYLLIVKYLTGHYTGYPRLFREDLSGQIFYVFKAFAIEINYLISTTENTFNLDEENWNTKYLIYIITFLFQIFPLIFLKFNKLNYKFSINVFINKNLNLILTFFAFFYFFPTLMIAVFTNIDPIYLRSMSPLSFLIFCLIFVNVSKVNVFFRNYIIYLISISLIVNLLIPIYIF